MRAIGRLQRIKVALDALRNLLLEPLNLDRCEVAVTVVDSLDLLPSMATTACENSLSSRHRTTKRRQTLRMPAPLLRRKSAMVLKSGARRPVSHINSRLRWHSCSNRRLD